MNRAILRYSIHKFLALFLVTAVLSTYSVFALNETTTVNEYNLSDTVSIMQEENPIPYVEGEIIIMLANTSETESLQLYSVYSDDYQSINQQANSNLNTVYSLSSVNEITVAGSTDSIENILDLGINVSEMKLLNPVQETSENNMTTVNLTETSSSLTDELYTVGENGNNIFSVKFEDMTVGEALEILNENPLIEKAEPNYIYELYDTFSLQFNSEQYSLLEINAPGAWVMTGGSQSVSVGIIDSGIDGTHPDLVNNLWNNPYYTEGEGCSVCSRTDDIHGYNFTGIGSSTGQPCGGTPTDTYGHGTHVAGIVGARSEESDGVCGVSPYVSLVWLGCAFNDEGLVSDVAVIEAINYAKTHNITILNVSYGGHGYSSILESAINDYDGLFIAAAGNESVNNDEIPTYPASYNCPNIISVGASDENNDLWRSENDGNGDGYPDGSNCGINSVHITAPGAVIYNTWKNGSYEYKTGTSMATPHVTGIAALIKALRPQYNTQQIKAAICNTVQDMGKTYNVIYDGGIVDAEAAVSIHPNLLKSVTFNYNYTGAPTDFVDYVVSGNAVREPAAPQRSGYILKGWSTSASGGELFEFDTVLTSNTTLYAQWETPVLNSYGERFPDYYFRKYVLELTNEDGGTRTSSSIITQNDKNVLETKPELNLNNKKISNLTGIEFFSGIEILRCNYNIHLSYIDLSAASSLKKLYCYNNEITSLNLNNATSIEQIYAQYNLIETVNLSNCSLLKTLYLNDNKLEELDVSDSTKLITLDCSDNKLITLMLPSSFADLSNQENETSKLFCNNNQLTSLVLPAMLNKLNCENNLISSLNNTNSANLTFLDCSNNQLTTLVTGSGLLNLDCTKNFLEHLNISASTGLNKLYCSNNNLTVFSIVGLDNLTEINAAYNNMNDERDVLREFYTREEFVINAYPPKNWGNKPFTDVSQYDKAIEYVCTNGIMEGTSSTTFSPNNEVTRAEIVEILYEMAGSPSVSGLSNPFTDVPSSASYCSAVKWAYNNGINSIVSGTSTTTFSPNDTLDRRMAAVIIDKYAERNDVTITKYRDYIDFADEDDISSWAIPSVQKLYEGCIMDYESEEEQGYCFSPRDVVTKRDLAVIIRLYEVIRLYA